MVSDIPPPPPAPDIESIQAPPSVTTGSTLSPAQMRTILATITQMTSSLSNELNILKTAMGTNDASSAHSALTRLEQRIQTIAQTLTPTTGAPHEELRSEATTTMPAKHPIGERAGPAITLTTGRAADILARVQRRQEITTKLKAESGVNPAAQSALKPSIDEVRKAKLSDAAQNKKEQEQKAEAERQATSQRRLAAMQTPAQKSSTEPSTKPSADAALAFLKAQKNPKQSSSTKPSLPPAPSSHTPPATGPAPTHAPTRRLPLPPIPKKQ